MKTATVTGATGFIASELIAQLLAKGYAVKATARCAPDAPRLAALRAAADGAPGSLEIVQARGIAWAGAAARGARPMRRPRPACLRLACARPAQDPRPPPPPPPTPAPDRSSPC
jgi:nucleoside-diphosphate-sugar epimerase